MKKKTNESDYEERNDGWFKKYQDVLCHHGNQCIFGIDCVVSYAIQ